MSEKIELHTPKAIELQLFDWEGWDIIDTASFGFYNCETKTEIGDYPVGKFFTFIIMDYEKSVIELYEDEECEKVSFSGNLKITVE